MVVYTFLIVSEKALPLTKVILHPNWMSSVWNKSNDKNTLNIF